MRDGWQPPDDLPKFGDPATADPREQRIAELEAVLRKIADPTGWIQANLKPGERLEGSMAYMLSNDPTWLRGIARDALEPKPMQD